jgi:hypothetical protein
LQNRKERIKTAGISVEALHVALHVSTRVLFSLSLSVDMNVEINVTLLFTVLCIRAHIWREAHTFKSLQSCPNKSYDYSTERITLLQESDIHAVAWLHSTAFVVLL